MKLKPLHISQLRLLMEKQTEEQGRVPFSITYACLDGTIIDVQEKCMVCISVDTHEHRRRIKSITSGEIRTVYDSLILRVNDSKIVVN